MTLIQERTKDNSLVSHNPLDGLFIPFYDPSVAEKITQTGMELIRTTFADLEKIIPYEQLEDLCAHGLLQVERYPELIFLDVDGVLNTDSSARQDPNTLPDYEHDTIIRNTFCDEALESFKDLLKARPNAKIVVSSVWRNDKLLMHVLKTELGEYADRIIGKTGTTSYSHRGMEIEDYLLRNFRGQTIRMAIIDDDSDMLLEQKPFHIHTDVKYGFNGSMLYRARYLLENKTRAIP